MNKLIGSISLGGLLAAIAGAATQYITTHVDPAVAGIIPTVAGAIGAIIGAVTHHNRTKPKP